MVFLPDPPELVALYSVGGSHVMASEVDVSGEARGIYGGHTPAVAAAPDVDPLLEADVDDADAAVPGISTHSLGV